MLAVHVRVQRADFGETVCLDCDDLTETPRENGDRVRRRHAMKVARRRCTLEARAPRERSFDLGQS